MTTFDLEERLLTFACTVRDYLKMLPQSPANYVYISQLLRSSSSIGANYIEGNDAIGKKDFIMKMKTARREAKETRYWLRLLEIPDQQLIKNTHAQLVDEVGQYIRILSAIVQKVQS